MIFNRKGLGAWVFSLVILLPLIMNLPVAQAVDSRNLDYQAVLYSPFDLVDQAGDPSQIHLTDIRINQHRDSGASLSGLIFEATATSSRLIVQANVYYHIEKNDQPVVWAKKKVEFFPSQSVVFSCYVGVDGLGHLPPGVTIKYHWVITDLAGNTLVSPEQSHCISDGNNWKSLSDGKVTIWYYDSSEKLARALLKACQDGFKRIKKDLGIELQYAVDLYVYPSNGALRQAYNLSQTWAGAVALPDYSKVLIGCQEIEIEWGKLTVVHELTHLATRQMSRNAYTRVPTWLNEGISVYAEGPLSSERQTLINRAKWSKTLYSAEALCSPFPSVDSRARLAYAQSYSMVEFLIKKGGSKKLQSLLATVATGVPFDEALEQIYKFNLEEMSQKWFRSIGAPQGGGLALHPTYYIAGAVLVSFTVSLIYLIVLRQKQKSAIAITKESKEV